LVSQKLKKMILSDSWCHKSLRNYFVRDLLSQKLKNSLSEIFFSQKLKNSLSESCCHKSLRNYFVTEVVSQKLKKLFCQRVGVTYAESKTHSCTFKRKTVFSCCWSKLDVNFIQSNLS
jgi:hypothetical protein